MKAAHSMEQPSTTLLKLIACLAVAVLLACCQYKGDPAFQAVKNSIPDTDYPAAQIVGQWLTVSSMNYLGFENKSYMELSPDGTGLKRTINSSNGSRIIEATMDLRWRYTGRNRWFITVVPGSSRVQYEAKGWDFNPSGPALRARTYRLLPPRLYDVTGGASWVPLENEALVQEIHQEHRR